MEKQNALGREYNTKTLIMYALPTIITMVFMNTYMIVDGIFVAQYVGEDALSAINIVLPVFLFSSALSMVFATGGNAIVAKLMGQGKGLEAKQFFTVIYIIGIGIALVITAAIIIYLDPILLMMGANETLLPYCRDYLFICGIFTVAFILQIFTQSFFITAGKPSIGFAICLSGGLVNILLDWIFISPDILDMGISGAALATGIGASIPGIFGLLYFGLKRNGTLNFVKPKWDIRQILYSMYNGMSEFVGAVSGAILILLFNLILIRLAGKSGVAAISAILYIEGIMISVFMGYAIGVSPVLSYKFGEKNYSQMKQIMSTSFKFITVVSVVVFLGSMIFADELISTFISKTLDTGEVNPTFQMAVDGMRLFSIAYLFMGFSMYISASFTALSNGKISAILSALRTIVFLCGSLIIIPIIFSHWDQALLGVWISAPIAEFLGFVVSILLYKKYQKVYQY